MQWINTNEQLPDQEMRVLLYTPYEIFGSDHTCIGDRDCHSDLQDPKGAERSAGFHPLDAASGYARYKVMTTAAVLATLINSSGLRWTISREKGVMP